MTLDRRRLGAAGLGLVAVLLLANLGKFAWSAWLALGYPYDLDYGEGIVWQQLANILAGHGYAPLGVFPAIVYHYPPVYHLVAAAVAGLGLDQLAAGRLVSLAGALGSVLLIARWASLAMAGSVPRGTALIAAVLGGLSFLGSPTVLAWSSLMRVDMLACALTLAGLVLAARLRVVAAAIVFALAVYTKQTAIAGPAAAFVALWVARPRSAWTFLAVCAGLGLAALAVLMRVTDGEFVNHVLLYNVNRFDPSRWHLLMRAVSAQAISVALGVAGAAMTWQRLRPLGWRDLRARMTPADLALLLALIYLILRSALTPMILKSGANDNYLIDWFAVLAVFVALSIAQVGTAVFDGTDWPRALVTALVLIGLPVQAYRLELAHKEAADPVERADRAAVVARIAQARKPVIADDMVLLRRAGQPVLYEPAIAAELAHAGRYDEAAFAALVRRGDFSFFVTRGVRGDAIFDERYNPRTAAAIDAAYPRLERHGELVLHLPR